MRLGAARAEITPDLPIALAGFASRAGTKAKQVAHPLHLRVAVLESAGPGGPRRACVIAADLLGWATELVAELRPVLAAAVGAPADALMFTATHTHSGPATAHWIAPSVGAVDEGFLQLLRDRLLGAAAEAVSRLEPVTVARSSTDHELAMYRRTVENGRAIARLNPDGPSDPELSVVAFRRADGSLAATFVHYACHPVINSTNAVTGDFAGESSSRVEARTGATCLYLQGCCGDQNPGRSAHQGPAEVDVQADRFAAAVLDALEKATDPLKLREIDVRTGEALLPFQAEPTADELAAARGQDGVMGEWSAALTAQPERIRPDALLVLTRLDLADGLALLSMNAEVTVGYGFAIKRASSGRVLPVAYANGMIGYLPSAQQVREGGYEAVESARYYLLPGIFSTDVEQRALDGILPLAAD